MAPLDGAIFYFVKCTHEGRQKRALQGKLTVFVVRGLTPMWLLKTQHNI